MVRPLSPIVLDHASRSAAWCDCAIVAESPKDRGGVPGYPGFILSLEISASRIRPAAILKLT
jgi:hypothetical protein